MTQFQREAGRPWYTRPGVALGAAAAALAALAVANTVVARRVERRNPAKGRFIDIDGVRLHYLEKGEGPPVVLLHGNIVSSEDFAFSGVLDRVAGRHRVVAFDRPGFGHSSRPRGPIWSPARQADLIRQAFERLGLERPVVLGHSWGAMVAMALGLYHPDAVRGLVLLSGYYYPTLRADAALAVPAAVPVVGDVLRYTVSPLTSAALLPAFVKGMFAPCPVPDHVAEDYPFSMATRPWQIRAMAQDGTGMAAHAAVMSPGYGGLTMPVAIVAGSEDMVADVGRQSRRLHGEVPHSSLRIVPGVGHMVHHAVPDLVAEAVEEVSERRLAEAAS